MNARLAATGVVASVLAAAGAGLVDSPVDVNRPQRRNIAHLFYAQDDDFLVKFILKVKVKIIYHGFLFEEAYK